MSASNDLNCPSCKKETKIIVALKKFTGGIDKEDGSLQSVVVSTRQYVLKREGCDTLIAVLPKEQVTADNDLDQPYLNKLSSLTLS